MDAVRTLQDTIVRGGGDGRARPSSASGAAGATAPAWWSPTARCSRTRTTCAARRSRSRFADGRRATGTVAASTPTSTWPWWRSTPATRPRSSWGRPSALGIGAPVVALANPGGRGLRATLGFVSSGGRSFRGPRGRRIRGTIEHTAPLPRGSSGGPLVDPDGNLLGINACGWTAA